MTHDDGKRQIKAFVSAFRSMIGLDSFGRAQALPMSVSGGGKAGARKVSALLRRAEQLDTPLLYLEFEPGAEAAGPYNIVAVLWCYGEYHVEREGSLWLNHYGVPFLLIDGSGFGWASFERHGLDYRPGSFGLMVEPGLAAAATGLRDAAAKVLGNAGDRCSSKPALEAA